MNASKAGPKVTIHFVRLAWHSGILSEEIVDQFYHHAMKAGEFLVILGF
jgi:hypothetical protein